MYYFGYKVIVFSANSRHFADKSRKKQWADDVIDERTQEQLPAGDIIIRGKADTLTNTKLTGGNVVFQLFVVHLPAEMSELRRIIHIDMDQFYAAVEQRDRPELRGRPVAVGHDAPRGVVATASYEARHFGVHSAQAIQTAKRLCPGLIIVEPRFHAYKEVSAQIHTIFHDYTDLIEPLSLDEAFLDVTENKRGITLAVDIAREIKARIKAETQLTASAGVSYCKFLAKIASDYRKPDGLCVIHPDRAQTFIDQLRVERIWGVGQKTMDHMHRMGIFTGRDLRQASLAHLTREFGKMGRVFYDFARGIDERPVVSEWERKSVSCERTFAEDLTTLSEAEAVLATTAAELERRIARSGFEGRTLTLKVKYADFQQITRSLTQDQPLRTAPQLLPLARQLLAQVDLSSAHPVRLLGLGVSGAVGDVDKKIQPRPEWRELELEFLPW